MAVTPSVLKLDWASAENEIVDFIVKLVGDAGSNGVTVGLSGGIDSAVVGTLCVRALGKARVAALIMPSDFTPEEDFEDAKLLAESWGVRTHLIKISSLASQMFSSVDIEGDRIAMGNAQARIRMAISYYYANAMKLLVAGTGDRSEDLLGFFCYDEATRAVTTHGLKGMNELQPGDVVFSIDVKTRKMVESEVEEVFKFDYDARMIHFRGRGADLMVTPNHRMLVHTSSSNPDSRLVFRRADECAKSRDIITPVPSGWAGEPHLPTSIQLQFSQRHVRRTAQIEIEDAMYMFGLFIGDGSVIKSKVVTPVKSQLSRIEYATSHRGGDGRFTPISRGTEDTQMKQYDAYETDFSLPSYTRGVARRRLLHLLAKYGIGYSLTRDLVRVPSRGVYGLFAQCGIGAKNKRIPQWILMYPSQYLVHLLSGLKDSDGAHDEKIHQYYTSSEGLKDDFVQLCFKLGRRASVTFNGPKRPLVKGRIVNTGRSFTISYASRERTQHAMKGRLARKVSYKGKVWCPSVPPHENLLVERNGKYAFSGNTKFGDGGVDFMPIAHLYKTQVRELGKHLGIPERIVRKASSPRLWPGHLATDELPADYGTLDLILYCLHDVKMTPEIAAKEVGVGNDVVEAVVRMHRESMHKRSYPPMVRPW